MTQAHPVRLGKYEILSVLGRGGMGIVYKARDPVIDRVVAIKTISEISEGLEHNQIERLLTEARSAGRLHHPNIVTVFDFGEENGTSYIVLEYAEGVDLGGVIGLHQPLSLPERLDIILQICRGLGYAHDCGVTHRDMKPQNVRLMPSGVAKILDFGLARYDDTQLTRSGYISGTVSYMSPERLNGQSGTSDDIFALGAVAYELLTYHRAFPGEETPQILMKVLMTTPDAPSTLAEVPPQLDAIVLKCLAREIRDRYASAHDFGAAIEEVFESDALLEYATSDARSEEFRSAMQRWNTVRWRRETRDGIFKISTNAGQTPTIQLAPPTDVRAARSTASNTLPESPTIAAATEVVPRAKSRSRSLLLPIAAAVLIAIGAGALLMHKNPAPLPVAQQQQIVAPKKIETTSNGGVLLSQPNANELEQKMAEPPKTEMVVRERARPAKKSERVVEPTTTPIAPPPATVTPEPTPQPMVVEPPPRREEPQPRREEPPPPQPQPQAADPKKEIASFVQRIAAAYQSHDDAFFREHYLRYNDAIGKAVRNSPSQHVTLDVESIDVIDATHARVTAQRTDEFGKEAPPARQRLLFELERVGDQWKIARFGRP